MKHFLLVMTILLLTGCVSIQTTEADYTRQLQKLEAQYENGTITLDEYESEKTAVIESRSRWRSGLNSSGKLYMGTSF